MDFWAKRFWQIFGAALLFFTANAQQELDSLTKIVNDPSTADTTRIKIYGDMAWSLLGSDLNLALQYAKKELELATKIQRKEDVAQAYSDIGSIYNRKAVYDSALYNYNKSLALRQELKQEKKVAGVYSNIATVYMRQSDFKKALDINFKSLAIFEKYDDPLSLRNQGLIIGNIGNLYYELEMNDFAEDFYRRGLVLARKYNDRNGETNLLLNLGGIKFDRKDLDSALFYFREAEKAVPDGNQIYSLAAIYNVLGKVYFEKKDYDKANDYYKKGLKAREDLGDKFGIGLSLANIGEIYSIQKKHKESIAYLKKAESILLELRNYPNLHSVYAKLANAYSAIGDFQTSLSYMEKYAAIKDSIYNHGNTEKLAEMQVKYEAEKKENENLKLQKENTVKDLQLARRKNIIFISSALFIIAIIGIYFLYQRNRQKQKQKFDAELLKQQEIRNKAIIEAEEKERIRMARDLHDGVGQLLSAAKLNLSRVSATKPSGGEDLTTFVVNAMNMIDDSVREVRAISHNMMPGSLYNHGLKAALESFTDKINATGALNITTEFVGMDNRLEQTTELVIYRVLQEIVSNCIRHAQATTLNLQLINHGKELIIMAEDNGKGFDSSIINSAKGIGLKNIFSRIGFLNGTVEFDSVINRGTTVIIEIPLN